MIKCNIFDYSLHLNFLSLAFKVLIFTVNYLTDSDINFKMLAILFLIKYGRFVMFNK